jgi:hypothetical protein
MVDSLESSPNRASTWPNSCCGSARGAAPSNYLTLVLLCCLEPNGLIPNAIICSRCLTYLTKSQITEQGSSFPKRGGFLGISFLADWSLRVGLGRHRSKCSPWCPGGVGVGRGREGLGVLAPEKSGDRGGAPWACRWARQASMTGHHRAREAIGDPISPAAVTTARRRGSLPGDRDQSLEVGIQQPVQLYLDLGYYGLRKINEPVPMAGVVLRVFVGG